MLSFFLILLSRKKLITQETILKRLLFILGRQILDHGQGDLLIHISTRPKLSLSHRDFYAFSMLDPSGMLNIMEEGDHQHKDNRHTSQTENCVEFIRLCQTSPG